MNTYKVFMTNLTETSVVKPKRGRKSKKDIEAATALNLAKIASLEESSSVKNSDANTSIIIDIEEKSKLSGLSATLSATLSENFSFGENEIENIVISEENVNEKPPQKKRGRKPKGGKIIQQIIPATIVKDEKPNVILHLKCSMRDLQAQNGFGASLEPFHFSNNKNELNYDMLESGNDITADQIPIYNAKPQQIFNETKTTIRTTIIEEANIYESDNEKEIENKQVWKKLKQLEHSLHINNIGDKKSACFWCTYDFDNPPVYIPKHFIKDSYQVYGCFCSPECAVAHLMEEHIDSSTKFERYHLLNHIYAKVYDYKKNIKPAPNVYYMLDKYYGNLSIQEYRSLLRNERFFLIVDKPLTRILPELHEDNEDHVINNKIIPSSTLNIKKKLQRKMQSKSNILNEKFGMHSANVEHQNY